jgi:hypothetical protein
MEPLRGIVCNIPRFIFRATSYQIITNKLILISLNSFIGVTSHGYPGGIPSMLAMEVISNVSSIFNHLRG